MALRSLFARKPVPRVHALPPGERIYAIGDIHGRADCLKTLMTLIDEDGARRGAAKTTLIFLGDLMDRGDDSRGVVEQLMALRAVRRCVFLMGNHEECLIRAWEGDPEAARLFHRIGGRATLMSYGISGAEYDHIDIPELAQAIGAHVPSEHIAFIRRFEDCYAAGDYLFVHAGVRPGVPLPEQTPADMRWIRREFLDDRSDHGPMVVHGHSITAGVDEQSNRIGIDTGAYATGTLTALGIEGNARWFLNS